MTSYESGGRQTSGNYECGVKSDVRADDRHLRPRLSCSFLPDAGEVKTVYLATAIRQPMSENGINAALHRLGYAKEERTSPGFRAMLRTLGRERLGIDSDILEA